MVDSRNRLFGYQNLYVCDGSVIAANLGVNPSLTICALTERAMSQIPPAASAVWNDNSAQSAAAQFLGGLEFRGPSLHDVRAEIVGRAAGEAGGEAAIRHEVGEQVIVHEIALRSPGEVVAEENVEAAAKADEKDIVGLGRRGDQAAYKSLDHRILRLRGRGFMHDSRIYGTEEQRRFGKAPVGKLRTYREGVCPGMRRDAQAAVRVVGRQFPRPDPRYNPVMQLRLQLGKQLIRPDRQIATPKSVVDAERHPGLRAEAGLHRKAMLEQADSRAIEKTVSSVHVKPRDVRLFSGKGER